jgi:Ca2+/H+ antiporter
MSLDDYLNELMRGSSFKIFLLYLTAAAAFYLVWILGSYFGIGVGAIAAIDFIIAFALMYAPQSIVLDEETIQGSIADSVNFIFSQPILAVATILIGSMILALVFAFESLLDSFALPGAFVTLVLVLVFVLPLIEQMKSYSFIMKFDLLRSVEYYQSQARPSLPQVINAVRLRERRPGGKL